MSLVRDLMRYLFPKRRFGHNHGGRLISPYHLPTAADEERVLMLAGVARSPEDARWLMRKYDTQSAAVVLLYVKRRPERPSTWARIGELIRRIDGHDPRSMRSVYGDPKRDQSPVKPQYRYRVKRG